MNDIIYKEGTRDTKKILILTNYDGMFPFISQLTINIRKHKPVDITVLDYGNMRSIKNDISFKTLMPETLRHFSILKGFKITSFLFNWLCLTIYFKRLKYIIINFDVVIILCYNPIFSKQNKIFKNSKKRIVISYIGSDIYKTTHNNLDKAIPMLDFAHSITFNNQETRDLFNELYGNRYLDKTQITGFGLKILDNIKKIKSVSTNKYLKSKYNIDPEAIVITCGYNASPGQQHLLIVDKLEEIKNRLPQNYLILIPFTYGFENWDYYNCLTDRLKKSELKYKIIGYPDLPLFYLNEDQVAEVRIISDIVINIQVSDQASASLLEHLYAGSVVIVGDWLPYSFWNNTSQFYLKTPINKLSDTIINVIDKFQFYKTKVSENAERIFFEYNWERMIKRWEPVLNISIK